MRTSLAVRAVSKAFSAIEEQHFNQLYFEHYVTFETHHMTAHKMPSVSCSCYYYENVLKTRDEMEEEYYTMLNATLAQLEDAHNLPEHNIRNIHDF